MCFLNFTCTLIYIFIMKWTYCNSTTCLLKNIFPICRSTFRINYNAPMSCFFIFIVCHIKTLPSCKIIHYGFFYKKTSVYLYVHFFFVTLDIGDLLCYYLLVKIRQTKYNILANVIQEKTWI